MKRLTGTGTAWKQQLHPAWSRKQNIYKFVYVNLNTYQTINVVTTYKYPET